MSGPTFSPVYSSLRSPPLPGRQLPGCHAVEAPSAGIRAPPAAAFPLGNAALGPGAAARPVGKAPPQEAAS